MRSVARRNFAGVASELGGCSAAPQCEPLRDGGLLAWSANLAGATMRTVARRRLTGVVGELEAQQCEPLRDGAAQAWSANLRRNNANRCETGLYRRGRRTCGATMRTVVNFMKKMCMPRQNQLFELYINRQVSIHGEAAVSEMTDPRDSMPVETRAALKRTRGSGLAQRQHAAGRQDPSAT